MAKNEGFWSFSSVFQEGGKEIMGLGKRLTHGGLRFDKGY